MNNQIDDKEIKLKIDNKTKPIGALGRLEEIVFKICKIQSTLSPELKNPNILVFAGDHGIAHDGVCAYPQEVTYQMVLNFLNGGAAINVFAKQNNIELKVIDAGVNHDFKGIEGLTDCKIDFGTKSFLNQKAMTPEQCKAAMDKGGEIIEEAFAKGCNIIGLGEMGISNTSSAAVLMHKFTGLPIEECTGRGAGLDDKGLKRKIEILKEAIKNNPVSSNPIDVLSTFGGFEIVMMVGAILKAAQLKMILLIDGFIASAAFLAASKINHDIFDYAFFCHLSSESGHIKMLKYMNVEPILELGMRLGEGTGCAIAYPIIDASVNFINEMASFESAGVSKDK